MQQLKKYKCTVKREAATDFGLAPAQIAQTVNNATRGVFATQIISEEDNVYGVNVKYDEVSRQNIEQLKQLKLRTPSGQYIDLQDVATYRS